MKILIDSKFLKFSRLHFHENPLQRFTIYDARADRLRRFNMHIDKTGRLVWSYYGSSSPLDCKQICDAYSESKYRFGFIKSNKLPHKPFLLLDSTFFKLFFHIFAAIIKALNLARHKNVYTLLIECGRLRCQPLLTMSQSTVFEI